MPVLCVDERMHNIVTLFDFLVGASFYFFKLNRRYKIPKGTPSARALDTQRVGWDLNPRPEKMRDFRPKSPLISETVRDRPMITVDHLQVADRSVSVPTTLNEVERDNFFPADLGTVSRRATKFGKVTHVGKTCF